MSYIRYLSNPEGLYIWGDGKNVNFTLASEKEILTMPQKTFDKLIKKYIKSYGDDISYRGASIKEVFVKNNKMNPKPFWKIVGKYDGNYQMRLSYKNWHIDMWLVTWEYIINHNKGI